MQSLHRVRSQLIGMRTTLINQPRAVLLERGSVFPKGRRKLEIALTAFLADAEVSLAARIRTLLVEIHSEWASLAARIGTVDRDRGGADRLGAPFSRFLKGRPTHERGPPDRRHGRGRALTGLGRCPV